MSIKTYPKCYETHKALGIKVGKKTYKVYGGSCTSPVISDADIYVGLDSMTRTEDRAYPWVEGEDFLFEIPNMGVPKDPEHFKYLIEWMATAIKAGSKTHVGCVGGHGRTGLVLAALVTHMTGELDSITYVRKNYCKKAVEAEVQMSFLNEQYGVKKLEPSYGYASKGNTGYGSYKHSGDWWNEGIPAGKSDNPAMPLSHLSIWGKGSVFL